MPVESIGPFLVNGPRDFRSISSRKHLKRLDHGVEPTDHFIRGPFDVIFHPVGNVPGTNSSRLMGSSTAAARGARISGTACTRP